MDPILVLVLVVIIGIAVGLGSQRMKRSGWLTRQIAGGRRADLTSALVGIAGAFIGFHVFALLTVGTLVLLIGAVVGAAAVVWGWREVKL